MGMYKATKLSAWTPEEIKSQRVAVRRLPPMRSIAFWLWD